MMEQKTCACPCHKMAGILVALFGLNFLLKALGVYDDHISNIVWPALIMAGGLSHSCKWLCKCCSKKMT